MYTRTYLRQEIMRYLVAAGVPIDIYGTGWDRIVEEEGPGRARLHPPVSYKETGRLCRESKILLNVMPWFRDGYHDRICTGLLNGCPVLTDASLFLKECYTDQSPNREIYYYDISHPELVADQIMDMLFKPEELYQSAVRGQKKTEELFSWETTAKKLLEIMAQ